MLMLVLTDSIDIFREAPERFTMLKHDTHPVDVSYSIIFGNIYEEHGAYQVVLFQ